MKKTQHVVNGLVDGWRCPICKKDFKSDGCPHSWTEVHDRNVDDRVRRIVREEMKKK